MSFIATLILSMFVGDLLWWAWMWRRLRPATSVTLGRIVLSGFMGIQISCLILIICGRVFSDRPDEWLPRFVLAGVFIWHFILLPVVIVVMVLCLLSMASVRFYHRISSKPIQTEQGLSRRQFLRVAAAAGPPVATALTTGLALSQLEQFRIRSIDVPIRNLPEVLNDLCIVQVSDIHVGRLTSGAVLRKIADATNALHGDLVLLTGDLINHSLSDLAAGLDVVRRMDARYGVFMCEGNHDLIESRAGFEQAVKKSDVPLLLNESTMLNIRGQDVQLMGLKWGPGRGDAGIAESMRVLVPQLKSGAFPILMAHHPHAFDPAAAAGIPLTLSGHSHGGQLMASPNLGFGPLMFRYWSGLYEKGDSKLIVSNGVGNWFPLRINAPAEIVKITLHSA